MSAPTILSIRKQSGIAGHLGYTATVQYEGEPESSVTFVGSVYGGPVVMVTPSGMETFVRHPDRFGDFGESWVRRFFAGDESS